MSVRYLSGRACSTARYAAGQSGRRAWKFSTTCSKRRRKRRRVQPVLRRCAHASQPAAAALSSPCGLHCSTSALGTAGTAVATLNPSTDRSLAMPSVACLPLLACPPHGHNTLSLTHSPTRSLTQRFADHTVRLAGSSLQPVAASCAVLQQDDAAQHSECGRRPSGATRTRMAQSRARRRICAYGCSTGPSCTR